MVNREFFATKKNRINSKELDLNDLESITIYKIQRLLSLRSKSLNPYPDNKKETSTIGNWALPYLNMLKQIGFIK